MYNNLNVKIHIMCTSYLALLAYISLIFKY